MEAEARVAVKLEDYRPPAYSTESVELSFALDPAATLVTATQTIARCQGAGEDEPLVLYGVNLETVRLAVDGLEVAAERLTFEGEEMRLAGPLPARFVLEAVTRIDPQANTSLMGLYVSNGVYCTQCEAEGFRKITWFQDRPDVMARYRVRLEADKAACPVLLSNGNLLETGTSENGRHWALWEDPFPKPSYLFALVAGDLAVLEDSFTTMSGREVALKLYSEPENIGQCGHAMESLKKSMRWDEERYGLEYDLDLYMIVAVSDFNMGAMENKGLNVFNTSATLAAPETATDADFVQVERIIAHEYFHNWTGNRVTCRDWFQLTLKEGLTVFRDQQFTADMHSPAVKRIGDVVLLREGQFVEDAGPLAHPIRPDSYIEINNFYTRTVYEKGAEIIRMIHTLIGEEDYRRGIDLYFERFDGQAVTCEDFVAAMADASGRDLKHFFAWYGQAGTPQLTVDRSFDPNRGEFALTLSQHTPPTPGQPDKVPLHVPVRVGLLDGESGEPLPLRLAGENEPPQGQEAPTERVLELTEASQTFTFTGLEGLSAPVPSVLRGFSAPVKLDTAFTRDELAFLLAHDTDSFNRWDAGQSLALEVMREMLRQRQSRLKMVVDARLTEAFRAVLEQGGEDQAFTARALQLPSRNYLAQGLDRIDVEGIIDVSEALIEHLGTELRDAWQAVFEANAEGSGAFSIGSEAMGRRSLKNLALAYMMRGDPKGTAPVARRQYENAANMTDRLAALRGFCAVQAPGMDELLDDFYRTWRHEPLVLNKWFALQAMIEDDRALERVEGLMRHPDFKLSNPNRVRSLIGGFAMANLKGFHRADGGGYRFLTDLVVDLDGRNPQIASRLLTPLGRWRRYDKNRQGLMKAQLERVLAVDGLSKDSYEIASKSLRG